MNTFAILCGVGASIITWKAFHLFWSLSEAVYESAYSYFLKRVGAALLIGFVVFAYLSPEFNSSNLPKSTTTKDVSIKNHSVIKEREYSSSVNAFDKSESVLQSDSVNEDSQEDEAFSAREK